MGRSAAGELPLTVRAISAVMIVADAVFLPDRFYRSLGRLWARSTRPPGFGKTRDPARSEPALVPAQPGPAG
ncbi:hypothetical protein [Streptomyces narbonensis]|uniref:hypothetical protein n=1 Tax=Streptomyces narbonensis TaxID=67333 RepID=UPI0033C04501